MAIHPDFSTSPHEILNPEYGWYPASETLRETSYEKLLLPLVYNIRQEVKVWRDNGYQGASETSKSLLKWWFCIEHVVTKTDGSLVEFKYYFARRVQSRSQHSANCRFEGSVGSTQAQSLLRAPSWSPMRQLLVFVTRYIDIEFRNKLNSLLYLSAY